MINTPNFNELADKLASVLPENLKTLQLDVKSNLKATLESGLQQMNLVSREEFDVQSALLARTLEKLKALEEQVATLEKNKIP